MDAVAESEGLDLLWKLQVLSGAGALVIGLVAMVWPLETGAAVVILWGFFVLVDAVGLAVLGFLSGTRGRGWVLLAAAGTALVGLVAVFRPGVAAATALWVVGIWLVVRGLFEGIEALRHTSGSGRWLL